tara:strand:- start:823 stop:1083 length:261 start_codon:yes stop_codon:yes gene_type:complete
VPGVSRDNDSAGGDLIPTQSTVYANGKAIIVDNDPVAGHGIAPHASPNMIAGSNDVYIGNKSVVNAGDSATCGHTSSGSSNVNVGD